MGIIYVPPTHTFLMDFSANAQQIATRLKARGESIAIAESSAGGLISAALLSISGASSWFLGGAVVYTRQARRVLLSIPDEAMGNLRPSTEAYALLLARTTRDRFGATWALAETGATGPTGNHYGDAAGHACIGIVGPAVAKAMTLETGRDDRSANMRAFTEAALGMLARELA